MRVATIGKHDGLITRTGIYDEVGIDAGSAAAMAVTGCAIAICDAQAERPFGISRHDPRACQQVEMGCVEQSRFAQRDAETMQIIERGIAAAGGQADIEWQCLEPGLGRTGTWL